MPNNCSLICEQTVNQFGENRMKINGTELTASLEFCSADFVEKLVISFGDEAVKDLENTSTLKAERELLETLILEAEDETVAEMMVESIKDFAQFVQKNEADLRKSKAALDQARNTYKKDKQKYEENTHNKLEALDEEFEIDPEKLAAYQLAQNKLRAKKLRAKARHRGLVAIAKGTVAATIDGVENQYFKTTTAVVTKTIEETKSAMRNQQAAGNDTDTEETFKALEEAVSSTAEKISKETNGGKDVAILNASMDAARASAVLALEINNESLPKLEQVPREHHEQRIQEHMRS